MLVTRMALPCMIALAACGAGADRPVRRSSDDVQATRAAAVRSGAAARPAAGGRSLPARYVQALACVFDENPVAAAGRMHTTPAGRAERAADLTALRALGFARESRDGDLASVGGRIDAPAGLVVLGLPVRSVEINGMIGDTNAMYVTTFAAGVTVAQVVRAARLDMDRASYARYRIRHYARTVGNAPDTSLYLDDRGRGDAVLTCRIQGTPD